MATKRAEGMQVVLPGEVVEYAEHKPNIAVMGFKDNQRFALRDKLSDYYVRLFDGCPFRRTPEFLEWAIEAVSSADLVVLSFDPITEPGMFLAGMLMAQQLADEGKRSIRTVLYYVPKPEWPYIAMKRMSPETVLWDISRVYKSVLEWLEWVKPFYTEPPE